MNARNITVIVIVAAVISALVYLALREQSDTEARAAQFEQDAKMAAAQADSLNTVIVALNERIDAVGTRYDSSQAANRRIVAALQRVGGELKEYRRIAEEQLERNKELVAEVGKLKVERDRSMEVAQEMKARVDSLNAAMHEQSQRLAMLEARMQDEIGQREEATRALSSLLVHIAPLDELVDAGYLKVKDTSIFTKNYYVIGFPEQVVGEESPVVKVAVGSPLLLSGELKVIAHTHGKLKNGREYTREKGDGQEMITFTDSTLVGQRLLVVMK